MRVREPRTEPRPDWRDTIAGASDLALLGIVLTVVALPVVTLGGAVAAGSLAVDRWCTEGRIPPVPELVRCFVRGLLPGVVVVAVAAVVAGVFWVDLAALDGGHVPGGPVVRVVTLLIAVLVVGLAALTAVRVGQRGGSGWRPALRSAWQLALARPLVPLALAVVLLVPLLIGMLMPVIVPALPGVVLLGLHATTRRLAGQPG